MGFEPKVFVMRSTAYVEIFTVRMSPLVFGISSVLLLQKLGVFFFKWAHLKPPATPVGVIGLLRVPGDLSRVFLRRFVLTI